MALTSYMSVVAEFLVAKLDENKLALGLQGVFYGDQEKLPYNIMACVEPDTKTNELWAAQRKVNITFQIFIIVYVAAVDSPQINRRGADVVVEAIEDLIHQDRTLSGLVIHGYVESVTSGYVTKNNSLVRASRLTFSATSQRILPS